MRPTLSSLAVLLALAGTPAILSAAGSAFAQADQQEQVKQVDLTDEQIDNMLAAKQEMDAVLAKVPESADQPDAKTMALLEKTAKAHKFSSYGDYDNVSNTVSLVMAGIDPETKAYVGPEAVTRKQIAEVQADKKLSAKDKKEALDELKEALKSPVEVTNKANVAVVLKHLDKLTAAMSDEG